MQATLQTTTTFSIEGYRITEYKGLVRGIVVRSPTIGQGILGGLKQIVGGQIGAYAEMCEQARQQAYDLLLQHARELRANAVVGVRYESSEVGRQGSDRKSTRLNSSHANISYAVFCLKKKKRQRQIERIHRLLDMRDSVATRGI